MSFAQPSMSIDRIDAEANNLHAALVELVLDAGHVAQFGGAHRREIFGMREHHAPGIAKPLVKANWPIGGLGFEVGGITANGQRTITHAGSPDRPKEERPEGYDALRPVKVTPAPPQVKRDRSGECYCPPPFGTAMRAPESPPLDEPPELLLGSAREALRRHAPAAAAARPPGR